MSQNKTKDEDLGQKPQEELVQHDLSKNRGTVPEDAQASVLSRKRINRS
jgi:hypothetical protein